MKPITNNLKKLVSSLKQKNKREENNLFIAEGERLCSELFNSAYQAELVIVRSAPSDTIIKLSERFEKSGIPVYIARKKQFEVLCDTKTPQGILAVVNSHKTKEIAEGSFIALDCISDPGNLGTIIRTADWFGFENVYIGGYSADKFNPKTVRATMGSLFRLNVEYFDDLKKTIEENFKDYEIFGADLKGELKLSECRPKNKFGIIFGNEANGISPEIYDIIDKTYVIPGAGLAESLNVSVSAGVSMYHFANYL